jgi:hypothetical protein
VAFSPCEVVASEEHLTSIFSAQVWWDHSPIHCTNVFTQPWFPAPRATEDHNLSGTVRCTNPWMNDMNVCITYHVDASTMLGLSKLVVVKLVVICVILCIVCV